MSKKLRLAAIGIGLAWERLHYPALKELTDKYEIVALSNRNIEKAKKFAKIINLSHENIYSDYKEMLKRDDIDVVDTLVPISDNYNVAKDVILSGKNLIAEKPFAETPEAAKDLIELKNRKNVKVMVAENFRYEECYNLIKNELNNKTIGDIVYFTLNTGADFEKDMLDDTFAAKEWRQHPTFKGGMFLDGGIHDIALIRYLFGDSSKIHAFGNKQNKEYCEYMNINAIIDFKNENSTSPKNVIGNYSYFSSGTEKQKPPIGLRIFGTKGDIYLESKESETIYVNFKDDTKKEIKCKKGRGYYNEFLNYFNGDIVATPEKELGDIQMIFDIMNCIDKYK